MIYSKKKQKKKLTVSCAIDLLEREYFCKRSQLNKRYLGEVIETLREIMSRDDFNNIWSRKWINIFNGHPNIINVINNAECQAENNHSDLESSSRQAKFEITIMMVEIVNRLCRVSELIDRSKTKVYLTLRQDLAVGKDESLYQLLDDYHQLLQIIVKKNFNVGSNQEEIQAYLTLRLIAVDGVLDGRSDWRISHLTADKFHCEEYSFIYVRSGLLRNEKYEYKQYFITDRTSYWLKILSQRAKGSGDKLYLFSEAWRKAPNHKKTVRRNALNKTIESLWCQAYPGRDLPYKFDISTWIKLAQVSFEVLGSPYICIANMRNKIRGAHISISNRQDSQQRRKQNLSPGTLYGCDLILDIQNLIRIRNEYIKRKNENICKSELRNIKYTLAKEIESLIIERRKCSFFSQSIIDNANWFVWLLTNHSFDDLSLSTIMSHTCTIKNRVLLEYDIEDPRQLPKEKWEFIAESIAQDEDYSSSSRRTSLTHLQRFHAYLQSVYSDVPDVDWKSYSKRVSRTFADCPLIFPSEVDSWINNLVTDSKEWFSGVVSFHIGLRCEEIFALTALDFEDDTRLTISRSKYDTSRRTIPWKLLLPNDIYAGLKVFIEEHTKLYGLDSCIVDPNGYMEDPSTLSKALARSMEKFNLRSTKMHALRHGFASWQLVRYFMLTDSEFKEAFRRGEVCPRECHDHPWFQDESLANFALIIGGIRWYNQFKEIGACVGRSIDIVPISKILGHNSRFTTLENYCNSLPWIQRHYLNRRLARIENARWSFSE